MAPLIPLVALFALALFTSALASPHVPRHVHNHVHRAISPVEPPSSRDVPPRRRRSLNKRCTPRPVNSTTSDLPTSTVPINVAPLPSIPSSLSLSSSSSSSSSPSPSPSPSPTSAPTDTTSSYVPPTTQAPSPSPSPSPTTSSTAPAQSSDSSGDSWLYGTQSGQGTYYTVGLGACGITNYPTQLVCAVSEAIYDNYPGYDGVNPNDNPVCGKTITASYGTKSVTVTVVDRCTGCAETDLDFSTSAFSTLADESLGRIDITWDWEN